MNHTPAEADGLYITSLTSEFQPDLRFQTVSGFVNSDTVDTTQRFDAWNSFNNVEKRNDSLSASFGEYYDLRFLTSGRTHRVQELCESRGGRPLRPHSQSSGAV